MRIYPYTYFCLFQNLKGQIAVMGKLKKCEMMVQVWVMHLLVQGLLCSAENERERGRGVCLHVHVGECGLVSCSA